VARQAWRFAANGSPKQGGAGRLVRPRTPAHLAIVHGRLVARAVPPRAHRARTRHGCCTHCVRPAGLGLSGQTNFVSAVNTNPSSNKEAFALARRVATLNVDILLEGETGAGKDKLAREIHSHSSRPGKLVSINCAAIPEHIVESELFGYEAGAFTGASRAKEGKLETADKGTLYLDEIDSMPQNAQAKLLRALQERGVERLGGTRFYHSDFRVIASTKEPLHALVHRGVFRKDLYFRLNVVKLRLPALRATPERVVPLFREFLAEACERHGRSLPALNDKLGEMLLAHSWPGNIRELRNAAERCAVGLAPIDDDFNEAGGANGTFVAPHADPGLPLRERVRAFERHLIESELQRCGSSATKASKALQMPVNTLYYRMKMLGLQDELDPGDQ